MHKEIVITIDLDGTLIARGNSIIGGQTTIDLLSELIANGCKLVVNTGRLDHDIIAIQKLYDLAVSARISQNGCVLVDETNAYAHLMNKQEAKHVLTELNQYEEIRTELNTVSNRYWKTMREPSFPKEYYDSHILTDSFETILAYQPVTLFLCVGDSQQLQKIQEYVFTTCETLTAVMTSRKSLEIYTKGISKGYALRELYPDAMIYGIGDSENDFSVFEVATKSYCVNETLQHPAMHTSASIDLVLQEIKEELIHEHFFCTTR